MKRYSIDVFEVTGKGSRGKVNPYLSIKLTSMINSILETIEND